MSYNEKTVFCEIGEGRVKKIKFTSNNAVGDADAIRQSLIKAAERDSHLSEKINESSLILQIYVKEASLYVDIEEDDEIAPNSIIKIIFIKEQSSKIVLLPDPEPSTSSNNQLLDITDNFILDVENISEDSIEKNENLNQRSENESSCVPKLKKQKIHSVKYFNILILNLYFYLTLYLYFGISLVTLYLYFGNSIVILYSLNFAFFCIC